MITFITSILLHSAHASRTAASLRSRHAICPASVQVRPASVQVRLNGMFRQQDINAAHALTILPVMTSVEKPPKGLPM